MAIPGLEGAWSLLGGFGTSWLNRKYAQEANEQQAALLQYQNEFNSAEAQKQRDWEQQMSSTAYQRARQDMEAAGINPILLGSGQSPASTPTGYAASSSASHQAHVPVVINAWQNSVNTSQAAERNNTEIIKAVLQGVSGMQG